MNAKRILIDTSVWIQYLQRGESTLSQTVDEILSENEVCIPARVIAELIQGAKSSKEIAVIEGFTEAFNIIDQGKDSWLKAGKLSYEMKKKGKTIHLIDCYIAVIAMEHNCIIFTLDKHFKDLQVIIPLQLF